MDEQLIKAIVDPNSKQIGCVLLQAALGGDQSVVHLFDDWLTAPTSGMGWAELTLPQWRDLAKKWNKTVRTPHDR
jgi:hypothetical protein